MNILTSRLLSDQPPVGRRNLVECQEIKLPVGKKASVIVLDVGVKKRSERM